MPTLPQHLDSARYWHELYRQPLAFWQAALDQIMAQHQFLIMARAMLYYRDDFARLIQLVPGAAQCRDWYAMTAALGRDRRTAPGDRTAEKHR